MELERYIPRATVSKLADRPKMTAEDLKRKFDEAENGLGNYINDKLVPAFNEEIGGKANSLDVENSLKKLNSDIEEKFNILDKKSVKIITITDVNIDRSDSMAQGYGISNCKCHEIYEAFTEGKTIVVSIPQLGIITLANDISERYCRFVVLEEDTHLGKYLCEISEDEGRPYCYFERYGISRYLYNDLDATNDGYALDAKQGKVLKEGLEHHAAQINNPHNVKAEQILVENSEDPLFGEGATVKQALYILYDTCAETSNEIADLSANKIMNDSDSDSPSGTVGLKLFELEEGLAEANKKIDNYHDEVNDTAVFEYMGSINPNRDIPSLSVDDDGKVYNISEDATHVQNYIRAPKAGTIRDYATHTVLELSDAGRKAVGGLELGDKIDLYNEDTGEGFFNVTILYIGEGELWFNAYIESDDSRNGMLVTLECAKYIDLKAGDNIVWTGYSWDNLSGSFEVITTDEVAEGNNLPVTSGGVFKTVGDIDKALEEIIAIQDGLMGVSE